MRLIKKILIIFTMVLMVAPTLKSFAYEWSKEEKNIWKIIETHWQYFAKEDTAGFLENFHPNFKGFVNWRALPIDKENLGRWIEYMCKNTDISIYTIEPVAINIHNNVAVVQYYCDLSLRLPSGQEIRSSYRYTDVLNKEKGKWLVIAAHKEKME